MVGFDPAGRGIVVVADGMSLGVGRMTAGLEGGMPLALYPA